MRYYIVYDTVTGNWLSHSKTRNNTNADLTKKLAPRLFTNHSGATRAMYYWLAGIHYMVVDNKGFGPSNEYQLESRPREILWNPNLIVKEVEITFL